MHIYTVHTPPNVSYKCDYTIKNICIAGHKCNGRFHCTLKTKITELFNPVEREYRRKKKHFIVIADEKKKKLFFAKRKKLTRLCPIVERLQIQNQV